MFLKNYWYVAATSDELGAGLLADTAHQYGALTKPLDVRPLVLDTAK